MSTRRRYSQLVTAAMKKANVWLAVDTGRPEKLTFKMKHGKTAPIICEMDFSDPEAYGTKEQRMDSAFRFHKLVVDKMLEVDATERAKVACCPTCSAWFPSFAARNQHREQEHSPAAAARRALEATPASERLIVVATH